MAISKCRRRHHHTKSLEATLHSSRLNHDLTLLASPETAVFCQSVTSKRWSFGVMAWGSMHAHPKSITLRLIFMTVLLATSLVASTTCAGAMQA
jgi:hypothetical protein